MKTILFRLIKGLWDIMDDDEMMKSTKTEDDIAWEKRVRKYLYSL
jgi:hypothetical protein